MRFIVTGGAGFIGSNLVEGLVELGDVTIIDDLSSGNLDNLEQLLKRDDVSLERLSVTDLEGMKPHFEDVNCVFHLAAVSNISSSVADPLRTNEVNVKGTLNVLLAARDSGVKKVVFTSSASVYGDTEEVPTTERALPNPLSPYAVTKLAGEHYCDVFSDLYGLETTSLRPFNVYGPRQGPNSQYAAVIPLFIRSLLEGEAPTIDGDGEQTRDFVYVKDVVRAFIQALDHRAKGAYNIAGGKGISINELFRQVSSIVGVDVEPLHGEPRPGDVRHSAADITRAKRFLGYEPEYDIRRGLEETIEWFST
jgi:UDP-glucose 4-epimerase